MQQEMKKKEKSRRAASATPMVIGRLATPYPAWVAGATAGDAFSLTSLRSLWQRMAPVPAAILRMTSATSSPPIPVDSHPFSALPRIINHNNKAQMEREENNHPVNRLRREWKFHGH